MSTSPELDAVIPVVKTSREFWASRVDREIGLYTTLFGYRNGELVCVSAMPPENEETAKILGFEVAMMNWDTVIMCSDVVTSVHEINPLTGSRWETGDMQFVIDHFPDVAKEEIVDGLFLMQFNRDQTHHQTIWTYRIGDDNQITWGQESSEDSHSLEELDSALDSAVRMAFKQETSADLMAKINPELSIAKDYYALSEVDRDVMLDLTALKNIAKTDLNVVSFLVAAEGSPRAEQIIKVVNDNDAGGLDPMELLAYDAANAVAKHGAHLATVFDEQ